MSKLVFDPIFNPSTRYDMYQRNDMYKRKFPMHHAADRGNLEGVRYHIKRGVSVNSRDDEARTPLHRAVVLDCYEVVQLLIRNHCNVDLMDRDGRTPVMEAAYYGSKAVADLLLQSGAQVHCANREGFTLLHWASVQGWVDVVQSIVESGEAHVNAATVYGQTPLMLAAYNGNVDVAVLLIRDGADFHRRDGRKWTALHMASAGGHPKVVQLLKEERLNLNPQNDVGDTPLHKACYYGCQEVVMQLLIAGADTNIKNENSETALSLALSGESALEEIRLFVQHGFFFEDYDYALISQNPVLKEHVLKDVNLCTQSIVNKFHRQSLPALYSNPHLAQKLHCIEKFHLTTQQVQDIKNFVKWDIETNTFCNVVKARPLVLGVLCVQSLLAHPAGGKRSASPGVSDRNSPLKKARHN